MAELRQHDRVNVTLHAKVRLDDAGVRYFTAVTDNLSAGGALLHLVNAGAGPRFRKGQRVQIAIAEHPRQAMLQADGLRAATIVRTTDFGHTTAFGVRFDVPARMAGSLRRAA